MQIEYCQHCHRNVPATKKINWGPLYSLQFLLAVFGSSSIQFITLPVNNHPALSANKILELLEQVHRVYGLQEPYVLHY